MADKSTPRKTREERLADLATEEKRLRAEIEAAEKAGDEPRRIKAGDELGKVWTEREKVHTGQA